MPHGPQSGTDVLQAYSCGFSAHFSDEESRSDAPAFFILFGVILRPTYRQRVSAGGRCGSPLCHRPSSPESGVSATTKAYKTGRERPTRQLHISYLSIFRKIRINSGSFQFRRSIEQETEHRSRHLPEKTAPVKLSVFPA